MSEFITDFDALNYESNDDGEPIDLDDDLYACKFRDRVSGKCLSDLNRSEFCGDNSPFWCDYYDEDKND